MSKRLVAIWDNGSFISTLYGLDFNEELQGLVDQYGPPSKVEYRDGFGINDRVKCHGCGSEYVSEAITCPFCGKDLI